MVRPIVLLFQEFATTTATPTTPDLNCIVIGPAYQLQDYPDDKEAIEVSAYGTLYANNPYVPPVAFTSAITLAAAPGLTAGAWVDPASIKVYFDLAQAILASGTDGVSVVTIPNENTFYSASATFVTAGVAAGDKLICRIPGQLISVVPHLVRTVLSVDSETTLRMASNFTVADTALEYRVERKLTNQLIDSSFVVTPTFQSSNEITILGGVTVVVGSTPRVVAYARVYVEYRAFRTDLQAIDSVNDTTEIETKIGRIDSRNPLAGALSVARQNAGTAPIYFYGVVSDDLSGYNKAKDAISADDGVYAIVLLTTNLSVVASFKADNESLADPNIALSTGVPQKLRVVIGTGTLTSESTVVSENIDANTEALTGAVPSGVKTLNLVSPFNALTGNLKPGDKVVLSASETVASIDGTYTIAHINSATQVELDEALPATIAVADGVNYTVTRPSTGATIIALVDNRARYTTAATTFKSRVAGATPGARTIALVQVGGTPGVISSIVEIAGVSTIVNADFTGPGVTSQALVNAINSGTAVTTTFTGSVNLVASTSSGATAQVAFATTPVSTTLAGIDVVTTAILDAAFLRLYDANAAFITAGVIAGDTIEIPSNPNGVFTTTFKQFIVDSVVSEQRLQIVNIVSGAYQNNTSLLERELPHTDNRLGTGTIITPSTIRYRVIRELSKDQQIAQLVTNAQSLNSRRAILTWPDVVVVDGLVDGSKPANPDGTAAAADTQPGWYLSAMVGGMTAGLPSHQGFSRLGGAGVSRLTHSSDYFTEAQLTDLSDGGWYVFAQNSPTALPYSIHQLTTDPSTLESGEYSIVKNFDFVSLYYLSVLEPFLGIWNINNDTLGFIRQAVNTATDSLKLRRVPRLGAPLNGATITSLAVSTASADRVEIYVEVDLPKPLNVIGLHLVA
jgi:hypothetical protein